MPVGIAMALRPATRAEAAKAARRRCGEALRRRRAFRTTPADAAARRLRAQ